MRLGELGSFDLGYFASEMYPIVFIFNGLPAELGKAIITGCFESRLKFFGSEICPSCCKETRLKKNIGGVE